MNNEIITASFFYIVIEEFFLRTFKRWKKEQRSLRIPTERIFVIHLVHTISTIKKITLT